MHFKQIPSFVCPFFMTFFLCDQHTPENCCYEEERRQKLNPLKNNLCVYVNWGSIMLFSHPPSPLNMSQWIFYFSVSLQCKEKWQCLFRISSCTFQIPFKAMKWCLFVVKIFSLFSFFASLKLNHILKVCASVGINSRDERWR